MCIFVVLVCVFVGGASSPDPSIHVCVCFISCIYKGSVSSALKMLLTLLHQPYNQHPFTSPLPGQGHSHDCCITPIRGANHDPACALKSHRRS